MRITNELSGLSTEVLRLLAPKNESARWELFRRHLNQAIWFYYQTNGYTAKG